MVTSVNWGMNVELSDSIISLVASFLMVLSCPNSRQTHLSLRLFILEWGSLSWSGALGLWAS